MAISIVQVALPIAVHGLFDYILPSNMLTDQQANTQHLTGCRVRVPFGSQVKIGVIVANGSSDVAGKPLKSIIELIDQTPFFDPSVLQTLLWAGRYYHHPLGEVFNTALPTALAQGKTFNLLHSYWQVNQQGNPSFAAELIKLNRAPQQKKAFAIMQLHDNTPAPESALLQMGITRAQLAALEQRGLIVHSNQALVTADAPVELRELPLNANPEQHAAISHIQSNLQYYKAYLLYGLTGSGKTEVYLQAMQSVLEAGKQVLILVPEIGLTPQTIARFSARFNSPIYTLHSQMTNFQRFKTWEQCHTGHARIIIGTRSAVFAPLPKLGMVIVDEEHDLSFKQQDSFRYHARELAMYRAMVQKIPIVLGTATPSLEIQHLANQGKVHTLALNTRAGAAHLNTMHLLDMRGQPRQGGMLASVVNTIRESLKRKEKVLVFLNRRGYAPILLCESCGWQVDCPRCDAKLTYHTSPHVYLHCHHCLYKCAPPPSCLNCQSTVFNPLGLGTARVEETLHQLFPSTALIRVDRDTTKTASNWGSLYETLAQTDAAILLGTQMLAKGHHFPDITLVVILDADGGFYSSDYRAAERSAQLILQVAGRAGRGNKKGQVLIQTWQPDNPLLQTLVVQGYAAFSEMLLLERKETGLPPFRFSALIRAESQVQNKAEEFLNEAAAVIAPYIQPPTLEQWGPVPAPMVKKGGIYRAHLLLFASDRNTLHNLIQTVWQPILNHPSRRGLRVSIDIDPQSIA